MSSSEEKSENKGKKTVLFGGDHVKKSPHARWLNTAIRSNRWGKDRNVSITYEKANGDVVERKVKPVVAKGHLLVAHDHLRNALRSFHIERIRKMEKTSGITKTAFERGFEKRAGILQRLADKAKGLFTGKKYLYHGTASENIPSIMEKGLLPGTRDKARPFLWHKGHLFMTTDRDVAEIYAKGKQGGSLIKASIPKKEFKYNEDLYRKGGNFYNNTVLGVKPMTEGISPDKLEIIKNFEAKK